MIEPQINQLIADGALFVSNHSGGKDSQVMMIELLKVIPREQLLVTHASLGIAEWPGALELAKKQAMDAEVPFIIARAVKTFFEMVLKRFVNRPTVPSWPSSSTRQCTSDLKRGPIAREVRRYAKANGFKTVVNCLGFRAEESPARSKRAVFRKDERNSNSILTWFEWLPIHEMPVDEVFKRIRAVGQVPHYAYSLGNDRLSCVFCIMGSRGDIQNGAKHNPSLFGQYVALENKTGYTMHQSQASLLKLVEAGTISTGDG